MDIAAIRQAMATAVSSTLGIQVYGDVPGSITTPAFSAGEVEIDFNQTFRGSGAGLTAILVKGRLYSAAVTANIGQGNLDSYLASSGATSVKAAIEADLTLGGVCRTLRVERVHGYGIWQVGGLEYYGAQFDVRVWAL